MLSSALEYSFPEGGFEAEAVVKWFNLTKGFGFVAPLDGSPDAFLHMSTLTHAGLQQVIAGTKLLVKIANGPKGRQVTGIVSVLGMSDLPLPSDHEGASAGPEVEMTGIVKWFKTDKGFGFVTPDDNDRDIFVHRSALQRAGLMQLDSGQKVKMGVKVSAKGREATWIAVV